MFLIGNNSNYISVGNNSNIFILGGFKSNNTVNNNTNNQNIIKSSVDNYPLLGKQYNTHRLITYENIWDFNNQLQLFLSSEDYNSYSSLYLFISLSNGITLNNYIDTVIDINNDVYTLAVKSDNNNSLIYYLDRKKTIDRPYILGVKFKNINQGKSVPVSITLIGISRTKIPSLKNTYTEYKFNRIESKEEITTYIPYRSVSLVFGLYTIIYTSSVDSAKNIERVYNDQSLFYYYIPGSNLVNGIVVNLIPNDQAYPALSIKIDSNNIDYNQTREISVIVY
jgi:hypothetical protein